MFKQLTGTDKARAQRLRYSLRAQARAWSEQAAIFNTRGIYPDLVPILDIPPTVSDSFTSYEQFERFYRAFREDIKRKAVEARRSWRLSYHSDGSAYTPPIGFFYWLVFAYNHGQGIEISRTRYVGAEGPDLDIVTNDDLYSTMVDL